MKYLVVNSYGQHGVRNCFSLFNFEGITFKRGLVGGLAQLGERLPCKQEVSGSNPLISTKRANSSAG